MSLGSSRVFLVRRACRPAPSRTSRLARVPRWCLGRFRCTNPLGWRVCMARIAPVTGVRDHSRWYRSRTDWFCMRRVVVCFHSEDRSTRGGNTCPAFRGIHGSRPHVHDRAYTAYLTGPVPTEPVWSAARRPTRPGVQTCTRVEGGRGWARSYWVFSTTFSAS